MGEREMILVLAALLFFSMTSLTVNRFCLQNDETMLQSEYEYYATSLAQGIIEEARTRFFDVAVESDPPPELSQLPNLFTYPLGPRWNESYPNFSDVDDYHGLTLNITNNNNPSAKADYTVRVQVGYVNESNLNQIVTYKTFYKRMTVTVTSNYLPVPVVLSHVFSYYEF